jgi:hypothetical protein
MRSAIARTADYGGEAAIRQTIFDVADGTAESMAQQSIAALTAAKRILDDRRPAN